MIAKGVVKRLAKDSNHLLRSFLSLALFVSIFSGISFVSAEAASNGLIFNVRQNASGSITANLAKTEIFSGSAGYCGSAALTTVNFTSWASPITCNFEYSQSFASGYIKAPFSGQVTLTTTSDDGVQVQVNDWVGIDRWDDHGSTADSMTLPMVAGNYYPIKIWYANGSYPGVLSLSWSWSGQASVIVPSGSFYQSTNDFDSCVARSGIGPSCPGSSALQIKQLIGTNSDGLYWIDLGDGSGAKATYSIMNSAHGGGGWMLAMKGKESSSELNYGSAYWKNATLLNSDRPSRHIDEDVDAKYLPFTQSKATDVMVIYPDYLASTYKGAYPLSGDGFAWSENLASMRSWTSADGTSYNFNQGGDPSGTSACATYPSTMQTIFSNSSRCLIRKVESTYSASRNPYDPIGSGLFYSQSQIRFFGFNYAGTSTGSQMYKARFGFGWNENSGTNEASNDGTGGIGLQSSGMTITSGTRNGCCATQNGFSGGNSTETNFSFELFVKNTTTITISGSSTLRLQSGTNATTTYSADQGNTPTFALSPVISGLTIDSSTGVVTAANSLSIGTYLETVTVSNALGASAVKPIIIQVIAASGETDTALTFNGSSQAAEVSDSTASPFDLTGALTLAAWVYPTSTCSSDQAVIAKNFAYMLYCGSSGFWKYAFSVNGSSWGGAATQIAVQPNAWHHIAFTKAAGSSTVLIYYDGVQVQAIDTSITTLGTNNSALQIGRNGTGNYFQGRIDEVRIYNSQRSAAQVLSEMHTYGPIADSNLVAYYDFNEGTGSTIFNRKQEANIPSDLSFIDTPTFVDVKLVDISDSVYTTVTFPRTYITQAGGWRSPSNSINYRALVVAGGGAGGARYGAAAGGGGGGGGFVEVAARSATTESIVAIKVGAGGQGVRVEALTDDGGGNNGQDSYLSWGTGTSESITALGGGGGAGGESSKGSASYWGKSGGSGGGASGSSSGGRIGGAAIVPVGSGYTSFGWKGGDNTGTGKRLAGGGGGAGGPGSTNDGSNSGDGGLGKVSTITGSTYSGGGGGGSSPEGGARGFGNGGEFNLGGGGKGGSASTAVSGTANTGGGGGGSGTTSTAHRGTDGGSGVIIITWLTAATPTFTAPATVDTTTAGLQYTFQISGSAISPLTRSFIWQSSSDTGTSWSNIQASASNSLTTSTLETATSGARYLYRAIVTDSDIYGLSITDTSTAFYLVINPRITISGGSFSFTQKYGESQTATFNFAFGTETRTASFSPGGQSGISWSDISSDAATLTLAGNLGAGTYSETITVTDSVAAQTSQVLTITVNKANAITISALDLTTTYAPNTPASSSYTITGLQNNESATVTLNYQEGEVGSSTPTPPTDAGTYSVSPSSLALLGNAELDNYEAPIYESATVVINRAPQAPLSIGQYIVIPLISSYPVNVYGGSDIGAITVSVIDSATSGCQLASPRMLTATSAGNCTFELVKLGTRNYLTETSTATIYWVEWVANNTIQALPGANTTPVGGGNSVEKSEVVVTANSFTNTSGGGITSASVGNTIRILITGYEGLDPLDIEVIFRPYQYVDVISALTTTYVEVVIPVGSITGYIAINGGPLGVSHTPTFTIDP